MSLRKERNNKIFQAVLTGYTGRKEDWQKDRNEVCIMKYFINYKTGGLICTDNIAEAERLINVGFTEITKEIYVVEYTRAWAIAVNN